MKLARAATGRPRIVSCEGAFHGLSLGTLSVSRSPRMRAPFEPLLPGCTAVPFGDIGALERALAGGDVAAFLVEPVQTEGGVRFRPRRLPAARRDELCTKHGTLLVLDEVQTGLGRTGSMFAFQQEGVVPDVLVLAKSAGGSIAPIGRHPDDAARFRRRPTARCAASICTARRSPATRSPARRRWRRCASSTTRARARTAATRATSCSPACASGCAAIRWCATSAAAACWSASSSRAAVEKLGRGAGRAVAGVALLERGLIVQPASQAWNVLRLEPPLTMTARARHRRDRRHRRRLRRVSRARAAAGARGVAHGRAVAVRRSVPMSLREQQRDAALRGRRAPPQAVPGAAAGDQPLQHEVQLLRFLAQRRRAARGAVARPTSRRSRRSWPSWAPSSSRSRAASRSCGPTSSRSCASSAGGTSRCSTPTAGTSTSGTRARCSTRGWPRSASRSTTPDAARHDRRRGLAGAFERAWRAVGAAARRGAARRQAGARDDRAHGRQRRDLERAARADRGARRRPLRDAALDGRLPPRPGAAHAVARRDAERARRPVAAHPHFRIFGDYLRADRVRSSRGERCRTCRAGVQSFNIDHVGNVSPCIEKIDAPFGNVATEPLHAIHRRMRGGRCRRAAARTAGRRAAGSPRRSATAARCAPGAIWRRACDRSDALLPHRQGHRARRRRAQPRREVRHAQRRDSARSFPGLSRCCPAR